MSTPHEGSPKFNTAPDAGIPGANSKVLEYKTGLPPLSPAASGRHRRQSKAKKAKAKNPERENTTLVFGPVETLDKFLELLEKVKQGFPTPPPKPSSEGASEAPSEVPSETPSEAPPPETPSVGVRSHYYREHQKCGFVYFHNEKSAIEAKTAHNGTKFDDAEIRVCAPLEYFDNRLDALPIPPKASRRSSVEPSVLPNNTSNNPASPANDRRAMSSSFPRRQVRSGSTVSTSAPDSAVDNPACTLVLKNINYTMKQEKLLELMANHGVPPQSVNYHYDQNGTFRGVAFAKYKRVDEAGRALEKLSGLEVSGRTLRAEFKRRVSLPVVQVDPRQRMQSITSLPGNFSFADSFGGETFDPQNMDPEQLEIFTQLTRFNQDASKKELTFPNNMTMSQRNNIHMVAEYLNLVHVTAGPPDGRYVVVNKKSSGLAGDQGMVSPRFRQRFGSQPGIRQRNLSFDMAVGSPLQHRRGGSPQILLRGVDPSHAQQPSWAKEQFICPKGPDGTRGFGGRGRGRRVSMPVNSLPPHQSRVLPLNYPPQHNQQSSLLPHPDTVRRRAARMPPRSTSVPLILREGSEFSRAL